jgi:hypothetical protein
MTLIVCPFHGSVHLLDNAAPWTDKPKGIKRAAEARQ